MINFQTRPIPHRGSSRHSLRLPVGWDSQPLNFRTAAAHCHIVKLSVSDRSWLACLLDIDDDVCAARSVMKDVRCGYEGGCAGQTRKHTLGCTADIWDQLVLGCAGGACGSVDLQLLDLTPDRVCSDRWHRHFSVYLCRLRAFPGLRSECWTSSEYDECDPCSVILGHPASATH